MVQLTEEEFEALKYAAQVGIDELRAEAYEVMEMGYSQDSRQISKRASAARQALSKLADFNLG